jgi:hypothetical protein
LIVSSGCAAFVAGGSAGPTIDMAGHVGLETRGDASLGLLYLEPGDERTTVIDTLLAGVAFTLGVERGRHHVPVSLETFVEYLRTGAPAAPWGFHVRVSLGVGSWRGGVVPIGVSIGPLYFMSQQAGITSTAGGPCFGRVAFGHRWVDGIDLSFRLLLDRSLVHAAAWREAVRFGLAYDLRREWFIQAPCVIGPHGS